MRRRRLIALVRAGLLRLDEYETTAFDLDHVNEAVAHAAANGGPFKIDGDPAVIGLPAAAMRRRGG